jgi:transcriptional regulator GlxA family with amidase domain
MTPFEYINDLKIRRAMYLLEVTSKSIEEIAIESGFNHYSHFYRLFMRKNGISPFEWRKKVRLNARLMEDK